MPYVNQPLPISNYEHELFNCFIIKPMWDTTNAIITHLDLPFRAASVQDLFEPIVKFMPNNIAHILNSNLIFLTIKAAYLVYREKVDIIAKK